MTIDTAKLKALRERYSPQPIPTCRLCGAEMSAQRISGNRITYGCTGATYDDTGCHYAPGRNIADAHYEQSQVVVDDFSDPDVIELIAALEAAEGQAAKTLKLPPAIGRYGECFSKAAVIDACIAAGINLETGRE
ncbi:ead/Ea22-like family protein [Cronobacter turicensis]|nr:ead/Ea22-like family protein [Cronobacter turicensis]EMA1790054.1 ead/Ea22-like family protein [Cronobacter turicensis]EMA1800118.1 ead/Ea22-like family protein [Cronobacter turicensis]EMA1847331.1 ead/Ea22-like family protein [Cronobacter turicensis]EMA1857576.1 ead/Ea22-like family protein [Cronobacter turicensis]